ncbi:uncharacterized protein LOC120467179 [Tachysurus ichikawai]
MADSIEPLFTHKVVHEGDDVTLSCRYKPSFSSGNNFLQWYRQYPKSKPEFLLYIADTGAQSLNIPPRMSAESEAVYRRPPPFSPLPLAQWFETVYANEILGHLDELKGVITYTYGIILKLDSTKKITKKLDGGIADTATWMTNIGNEFGQVLNCVLTTGEGAGLDELCQGIVKRYMDAGEPEPEVIYVDRDCCNETGV